VEGWWIDSARKSSGDGNSLEVYSTTCGCFIDLFWHSRWVNVRCTNRCGREIFVLKFVSKLAMSSWF
jgi:hypothetical protein